MGYLALVLFFFLFWSQDGDDTIRSALVKRILYGQQPLPPQSGGDEE
jgi:hypothetical protein